MLHYRDTLALERELRRLSVDEQRLRSLVSVGPVTFADVLAFLRGLPTGMGHAAFVKALKGDGLKAGLAASGVPPRDAMFSTPDIDEQEALYDELERVWPEAERPDGWGLVYSISRATVLECLRQLPDRAGGEALSRALYNARLNLGT